MQGEERGIWDIFCQVIDNYGDLGVSWRLATQLARRGHSVRLWVDDASALSWMAPGGCDGVSTHGFAQADEDFVPGDVVIEAFGCTVPPAVVGAIAQANRVRAAESGQGGIPWINLEYLSAESWVARSHGLASPVHGGAEAGIRKWFFFPGFTEDTGGLLREPDLMAERAGFDRATWLAQRGIAWHGEPIVTLFCYEPPHLAELLRALARTPVLLLVAAGRATAAVRAVQAGAGCAGEAAGPGRTVFLPFVPQAEFDRVLWCGDCNFVRGEDSLVRALWAGAPFVWQPYPQEEAVLGAKLAALLDWLGAPESLRRFHRVWNGLEPGNLAAELASAPPQAWRDCVARARARALAQDDLVSRLLRFAAKNR